METHINSVKAWFLAARPKTLAGAAAPVLVGAAVAWHEVFSLAFWSYIASTEEGIQQNWGIDMADILLFFLGPTLLCLLFALVMQVDANFINDYFDFKRGTDRADRLGPERACAQGWISPGAMRWGIGITTGLGCLIGLLILVWSAFITDSFPWGVLGAGMCCVVFCFLYTTHLSYVGLGDVLVVVFFGIVPVGFTAYVATGESWSAALILAGISMGLATDNLLMVNNYRDRHEDRVSGKRTIIVHIINIYGEEKGADIAQQIYLWLGIAAAVLAAVVIHLTDTPLASLLMLIYLVLHMQTYRKLCALEGRELNLVLGVTARNIFIFGLLLAVGIAC